MAQLASGTSARRVYLRNDDFWQELADYTNRVADELETLREDQESDVDEIDADEIDADEIDAEHPFPEVELTPSDEPTAAEVC